MILPAWAVNSIKNDPRIKAQAAPASFKMADSILNAPGWRLLGEDFYTCVPPADYAHDPAAIAFVREFDPAAQVIYRKMLYLPPGATGLGETVVATHAGMARYKPDIRSAIALLEHVELPDGYPHPQPNVLEAVFEDDRCEAYHCGGPGLFIRFDMDVAHRLRELYDEVRTGKQLAEDYMAEVHRRRIANAALRKAYQAPLNEKLAWAERYLSSCTIDEYKAWRRKVRARARQLGSGHRKPFLHMGSH